MRSIVLIIIFLSATCHLQAQQARSVKGSVKSALGNAPISDATVKALKSQHTITSNNNGAFNITIDNDDTLLISHIGFVTQRIVVAGADSLTVRMTQVAELLKNVTINSGYQQLKPNEVNGSYVVLDNKTLNQQMGSGILARLDGITSGLLFNVGKNNRNPENNTGISIRGLSTINGPLDPLIIIDNFIYDGNINNINPDDVESITILKDAAAASIWGARAGNGVVVITTKKGAFNQQLKIEFNSNVSFTGKPDLYYLPRISSSDYIDMEQFLFNQGYYGNDPRAAVSPAVQVFRDRLNGLISSQDSSMAINAMKGIDNRGQFTRYYYRPGVSQRYALNLHGGSRDIAWLVSGGYDKSVGNLRNKYDRVNLRFENTYRPVRNLNVSAGVYYTNSNVRSGMSDYKSIVNINNKKQVPYMDLTGTGGSSIAVPQYLNRDFINNTGGGKFLNWNYYPLEDYKHDAFTNNTEELLAHIGLNYHILQGLDASLQYQYRKSRTADSRISDTSSFFTRNLINVYAQYNPTTGVVTYPVPLGGIYNKSDGNQSSYNFRGQLNLDRTFNNHRILALAGAEIRDEKAVGSSAVYYGYNDNPLTYTSNLDYNAYYITNLDTYTTIPGTAGLTATEHCFVSLFSNASYIYRKKYILSGSFRRDGSNIFGANTNDKWKPLWSVGIGWEISQEQYYHIAWLPYLKISTTYGVSGNVDLSKTAMPVGDMSISRVTGFKVTSITSINNPELTWERSYQANFKVDFATARDRLSGSLEYYYKKGTDLYSPTPYDYTTWGLNQTIIANAADMKGNGVDVVLHSVNIIKPFSWQTDVLFNYNTSTTSAYLDPRVITLADLIGSSGSTITPVVGKPLYALSAYRWGGLDAEGNPQGYLNKALSIDYLAIKQSAKEEGLDGGSFKYIGPANPTVWGAVMNSFSFKGFTLSLNITFKAGYFLRKAALQYIKLADNGIATSDFAKRWQQAGDENITNIPSFTYPIDGDRDAFYALSEANVIKGDHIRLQFINLGYQFPMIKGLPLKNLQLYANVANLGIVWRANKDHIDPDYPGTAPLPKSFTIGLRTNF